MRQIPKFFQNTMSNFQATYRVGPHCFRITNSSATDIRERLPSLKPFVIPTPTSEDTLFALQLVAPDAMSPSINASKPTDINFEWEDAQCVIRPLENKNYLVAITPRGAEQTYYMECTDNFKRCTAYLFDEKGEDNLQTNTLSFVLNNFLMMLYAFNAARHHTLLMHASVIAHNGKGYLFLGKSATGKSTHTALCLKQDKEIYDGIVSTVTALTALAPVYHLKCLPNEAAAELCRKTVVV